MMSNKKLLISIFLVGGIIITAVSGFSLGWWQATVFEVVKPGRNQAVEEEPQFTIDEIDEKESASDRFFSSQSNESSQEINPLSGVKCKTAKQRALAVVLAGDRVARPLSGLSAADLVIELPVLTGGITRYIAIYVCGNPSVIGSLRSARQDFIPLAMGLDAILVHWGGSHYALDLLDEGVMDNINALSNPFQAFWRNPEIPRPHNGFTSMEKLISAAEKLGYRLENRFEGYPHIAEDNADKDGILTIGYPYPDNVKYEYDFETNSYYRSRGGIAQIDKNNGKQLAAKVVVVMRATSYQKELEYNDLDLEGSGRLKVYQNGEVINGHWHKDGSDFSSKLYFLDNQGEEINFVPGKIWLQIVEPYQKVSWEVEN